MNNYRLPFGATPLSPDEQEGLLLDIDTHAELDQFEAANIKQAWEWARKSRKLKSELLSVSGLLSLHKSMFSSVWAWAGQFRNSEKNIGNCPFQVQVETHLLCEDVNFLIKDNIECEQLHRIAIQFHHRLTKIHPFPNGNGRHARMAADLLLMYNGEQPFSWGHSDLRSLKEDRKEYIAALREADSKLCYGRLLSFAKGKESR